MHNCIPDPHSVRCKVYLTLTVYTTVLYTYSIPDPHSVRCKVAAALTLCVFVCTKYLRQA
jgi:hypothetical protein